MTIINLPNILTIGRILMTPFFIICLFYDHPWAKSWALFIFVVASITDAYDGYLARKNDQVTEAGKFLDPLADKILVSSAFISFAVMGVVEYWMVALIIFRDLFVTGLRIVMSHKGFIMITSTIAKAKTIIQISIIIFILLFLGLKALNLEPLKFILHLIVQYHFIYVLTLITTIFTVITGIAYLTTNRGAIKQFLTANQ